MIGQLNLPYKIRMCSRLQRMSGIRAATAEFKLSAQCRLWAGLGQSGSQWLVVNPMLFFWHSILAFDLFFGFLNEMLFNADQGLVL